MCRKIAAFIWHIVKDIWRTKRASAGLIIVMTICVYIALEFPNERWWASLSAVALIATLLVVTRYTLETAKIARLQEEEIGLKKKPVIRIQCEDSRNFYFRPMIYNCSYQHAKIRVEATITIDDTTLSLPEGHYTGERIWTLQAMGETGPPIVGNLGWGNILKNNKMTEPDTKNIAAAIALQAWVINYYEAESNLWKYEARNPIAKWYWRAGNWVPEI